MNASQRICTNFAVLLVAWVSGSGIVHAAASWHPCLETVSVQIRISIGSVDTVDARLQGGFEIPLSIVDANSGRLLWSAGAGLTTTQRFDAMDSGFTGSLAAIDLDADGLHDRIYAGDMAGRLWRFDLHHGAAAMEWATGGLIADFTNDEGRSFVAPPDISLSTPPGSPPSLYITIGTAAPGNAAANNRLYALRDYAVYDAWTVEDYAGWTPVEEHDLLRITPSTHASTGNVTLPAADHPGWYIELGSGHVITPTLTVSHRAVLLIAERLPEQAGPCEVFARTATLDLLTGTLVREDLPEGSWSRPLPRAIPLDATFTIGPAAESLAPCSIAGERMAACDVDTRPRRTWWRRSDAE